MQLCALFQLRVLALSLRASAVPIRPLHLGDRFRGTLTAQAGPIQFPKESPLRNNRPPSVSVRVRKLTVNFPMSINLDNTGIQPATDEAIRMRLLQELNRAYANAPRFADYSVTVDLWSYNSGAVNGLRWSMTAHGPDQCIVSVACETPEIAGMKLAHKFRQLNTSNT